MRKIFKAFDTEKHETLRLKGQARFFFTQKFVIDQMRTLNRVTDFVLVFLAPEMGSCGHVSRHASKNNHKTTEPLKCGRNCVEYLNLKRKKKDESNIYKIAKQESYNAINTGIKIKIS